jgi:hypothetical protein
MDFGKKRFVVRIFSSALFHHLSSLEIAESFFDVDSFGRTFRLFTDVETDGGTVSHRSASR